MPRLVIATRSADKLREIRALFDGVTTQSLLSLADLGIPESDDEAHIEAFDSFRENALAKARYFAALTGEPTLADDSGLEVDALRGEPGVRSRRFSASDATGAELDAANNAELLRRLAGVPIQRRTARYVCAAAIVTPSGLRHSAIGTCAGIILDAPAGTAGFGYDPLFFLHDLGASFGEVDLAAKQQRSHRARAFRALFAVLPAPL